MVGKPQGGGVGWALPRADLVGVQRTTSAGTPRAVDVKDPRSCDSPPRRYSIGSPRGDGSGKSRRSPGDGSIVAQLPTPFAILILTTELIAAFNDHEFDIGKLVGTQVKAVEQSMRACGAVMPDQLRERLAPHVSAMTKRDLSMLRAGVERAIDQCDENDEAQKSSLVLLRALRDCVADHHPKLSSIGAFLKTLAKVDDAGVDPDRLIGTDALPCIVKIAERELRYRGAASPLEYRERLEPHLAAMGKPDMLALRDNVDRLIQRCDRDDIDHNSALSLLLELRHCADEYVIAMADQVLDAICELGAGDSRPLIRVADILRKLNEEGPFIEVTGVFDRRMRLLNETRLREVREGLDFAQQTPRLDMPAFDVIRAVLEVVEVDNKLARDLVRWKTMPPAPNGPRHANKAKVHAGEPTDACHSPSVQPADAADSLQPVRIQSGLKRRPEIQLPEA